MLNYGAVIVSHGHLQELDSSNLIRLAKVIFRCVVVVDNLSNSDLKSLCLNREISYRANVKKKGFSYNANLGAKILFDKFDIQGVAFINPDVEIISVDLEKILSKEFLPPVCIPRVVDESSNLVDIIRSYPSMINIFRKVLCLILKVNHKEKIEENEFRWGPGFFLMVDKKSFEDCGGFDEGYRLYLEDTDIFCSLWMRGRELEIIDLITIKHVGGFLSRKVLSMAFWWHVCSYIRFWSKWGFFNFRGTDERS